MTTTQRNQAPVSIDDDMEVLTEQLRALRELAGRQDVDDDQIYDLSIHWGAALAGRLPRLVHYSALGRLDDADERSFQGLCNELRAVQNLIERFGLSRPKLPSSRPRLPDA